MGDGSKDGLLPRAFCARRSGVVVAAMLAAIGLLFVWQSSLLDLGRVGLPGPGFFPLVLGVIVAASAIIIGIERWHAPANGETIALGHRDVLILFAASLAVPLAFEPLGAYLTLGLFAVVLLVLIARVSPLIATAATVPGIAACWYFFQVLLGQQLPTGPF